MEVLAGASARAAARPAAAGGAGRQQRQLLARVSRASAGVAGRASAPAALAPQLRPDGSALGAPARRCRVACRSARPVRVAALFSGLEKLFKGDPSDKTRVKYNSQVAAINAFAPAVAALSDEQLRAKTAAFRAALAGGATLDQLLPEAFAVRRGAAALLRARARPRRRRVSRRSSARARVAARSPIPVAPQC
jgi:hypothetical protein